MRISFDSVKKCYGREPESISEIWTPGAGWQIATVKATKQAIVSLAKQGAKVFNLLVVDDRGQTHYADFKLSELTK